MNKFSKAYGAAYLIRIERAWAPPFKVKNGIAMPPPDLHNEGRALQLTVETKAGKIQNSLLGKLAGMAQTAGFDFVQYRDASFVYVSVIPDACQTKVDLMFVMDYSGSIASAGYNTEKAFAASVANFFDIGPDATRVASVSYGSSSRRDFDFNRYTDKASLVAGINSLVYKGGGTATYLALDDALAMFDSVSSGVRGITKGVPKICVVLTDGGSNSAAKTIAAGQRLKAANVNVFAIGAGNVKESELKSIASDPVSTHYFKLSSVSDIPDLVGRMASFSCNEPAVINPGQSNT